MSASLPTVDIERPGRALAIGAHPDDVEFCCGATLARWSADGTEVSHLICTDGSKGTWDPTADLDALVRLRQDEQRAAARALGATGDVVFLGEIDGELEATRRVISHVAAVIRRLRPDVVLAHDPWKRYRLHPDHRAAGFLALDAVVAARDPHFFPEHGLAAHRPSALLLFEADEPTHLERADEAALAARIAALEAHSSQFETTHFYRLDEGDPHDGFRLRERRKLIDAALLFDGAATGGMGEAFHLITEL